MTETVTIGCKVHQGIQLKCHRFDPNLSRMREIGVINLERHAVNGETAGVSKDLWDAWLEENRTHTLYTSGSVFLVPDAA